MLCISDPVDCSTVLCERPDCANPFTPPGECCPVCPCPGIYMYMYGNRVAICIYMSLYEHRDSQLHVHACKANIYVCLQIYREWHNVMGQ